MIKQLEQVKEFHEAFGLGVAKEIGSPSKDIRDLRIKLIEEETQEAVEEIKDIWVVDKVAKELADIIYVVYGTVLEYGLQNKFEEIFDEVHRSNMSKLENGKVVRREDGKVLKGKYYSQADIKKVIL